MSICIDNNLLIWGVQQVAKDSQTDMIDKVTTLLEFIENEDTDRPGTIPNTLYDISVPSITLGEFLAGTQSDVEMEKLFQGVRERFEIIEYDTLAAKVYGEIARNISPTKRKEIRNDGERTSRDALNADMMIYATAKAHDARLIITHDNDLKKISGALPATYKVTVRLIDEVVAKSPSGGYQVNHEMLSPDSPQ